MNLKERVLASIPHRRPMRFISDILEMNEQGLVGVYTWTDEDCAGHFPGFPVVPGVKLVESGVQCGCVAFAAYLLLKENPEHDFNDDEVGVFIAIEEAQFKAVVRPGDTVEIHASFGEEGYFRYPKMKTQVRGVFRDGPRAGEEIFYATVAGMWVPKHQIEGAS